MHQLHAPPPARPGAPDFRRLGTDWPHRGHSGFYRSAHLTWHVQRFGHGPTALLLHGTGASTHSFMDLAAQAADTHEVIAIDLPGHGFTQAPASLLPSQDRIAEELVALLGGLGILPDMVIGHSAGAAVMLALAARLPEPPRRLVSLNGALKPFPGLARFLFPATAQLMTFGGLTAHLLSQSARSRSRIVRLLEQTGGAPDDRYVELYWRLLQCSAHVAGTLRLMASWDLSRADAAVAGLDSRILFVAGSQDQAVDPDDANRLARLAPRGDALRLDRLGHLAHEQDGARVWRAIEDWLETA